MMNSDKLAKTLKKRGIVHVPTVRELATQGLAEVVETNAKGEASHFRPTKKGQKRIDAAMTHNAEVLRGIAAEYQQARVTEQLARENADNLMHLLNHASKGI